MGMVLGVGNSQTVGYGSDGGVPWWEDFYPGATIVLDFENDRYMLDGVALDASDLITGHTGLIDSSGLHVDAEDVHFTDQSWHDPTAGTLVVEASHVHATNIVLLGLNGVHGLETHPDNDVVEHYNGTLISANAGSGNWSDGAKAGLSWDSGNRRLCMGGGVVTEDASTAGSVSTIYLGSRTGTSKFWNGYITSVAYWPEFKSSTDLQTLTT